MLAQSPLAYLRTYIEALKPLECPIGILSQPSITMKSYSGLSMSPCYVEFAFQLLFFEWRSHVICTRRITKYQFNHAFNHPIKLSYIVVNTSDSIMWYYIHFKASPLNSPSLQPRHHLTYPPQKCHLLPQHHPTSSPQLKKPTSSSTPPESPHSQLIFDWLTL